MKVRFPLALVGALATAVVAHAEPPEEVEYSPTVGWVERWSPVYYERDAEMMEHWWHGSHLSGDWFGYRPSLRDRGYDFTASYANNIFGNPVGGITQGAAYAHNVGFQLDISLEKTIGWQDAHFVISGLDRAGRNLSAESIGNQFTVQQLYGNQTIVFYGLYLEQKLLEGLFELKFGRFAPGDDFYSSPIYWLYVNNAIDGNPQSIPVNAALPSYPNATWGARFAVHPSDEFYFASGAYQLTPRLGNAAYHGLDFSIRPGDSVGLVWEVGWTPTFFKDESLPAPTGKSKNVAAKDVKEPLIPEVDNGETGLPGHYKFGVHYSTSTFVRFPDGNRSNDVVGFYWLADQMIYREKPGHDEGLTIWSAVTLSPQEAASKLPFYASGGVAYKGLIPNRDDDWSVFAVYYGQFSDDFADSQRVIGNGDPDYELVFEWGYRFQLSGWAYIQPDIQWIIRPGGRTDIPNALAIGGQMGVNF